MTTTGKLASSIGNGLVAGLIGTASMTVSSTVEARLRHRKPSSAPARATAKVLGITSFADEIAQARFNDLAHWGYGTGWGVVRGLLDAAGLPPRAATATHAAAVWGSAQVALPALDVAPPAIFWAPREIAIDAFHHAVYAIATGIAYELLGDRREVRRRALTTARQGALWQARERRMDLRPAPGGRERVCWHLHGACT